MKILVAVLQMFEIEVEDALYSCYFAGDFCYSSRAACSRCAEPSIVFRVSLGICKNLYGKRSQQSVETMCIPADLDPCLKSHFRGLHDPDVWFAAIRPIMPCFGAVGSSPSGVVADYFG
jgi:hypothetical protein